MARCWTCGAYIEKPLLDYRTYIGLAETYLQMSKFGVAEGLLKESLPHAPKESSMSRLGGIVIPDVSTYDISCRC